MLGSSSDLHFVISRIPQNALGEDRWVVDNVAEERVEVEEEEIVIIMLDKNNSSPITVT